MFTDIDDRPLHDVVHLRARGLDEVFVFVNVIVACSYSPTEPHASFRSPERAFVQDARLISLMRSSMLSAQLGVSLLAVWICVSG